jgi:hypothetical protein
MILSPPDLSSRFFLTSAFPILSHFDHLLGLHLSAVLALDVGKGVVDECESIGSQPPYRGRSGYLPTVLLLGAERGETTENLK